ncbi:MAG: hypothetical protein OEO19_11230 [Gammaproteobacteria bacterium]|nr:hypothetical protein [Gammaproteobacteria bacterium]MDH3448226.1 hypothetical protein [Gammaproteobacteria bacterium]
MTLEMRILLIFCFLVALPIVSGGCAGRVAVPDLPPIVETRRIEELNLAILSLRADVDSGEARRAATIAIRYSQQLAREYEITDSAIVHNLKVNLGLRPRGLCVDWTADLLARLAQERFRSLDLHWAIANYESAFRLEHSTVVISARGEAMQRGLVLDPWRHSGWLYWAPASNDPGYPWKPQAEVHALKELVENDVRNARTR